jgi:hypothetical protein
MTIFHKRSEYVVNLGERLYAESCRSLQTIHLGPSAALISRALALISNCKCTARRAVDRTVSSTSRYKTVVLCVLQLIFNLNYFAISTNFVINLDRQD